MKYIKKVTYEHYRTYFNTIDARKHPKGPPSMQIICRIKRGEKDHLGSTLAPRGGMTRCIIELADGHTVCGEAKCSMADNFSYKIGREIAYGRATKAIEIGERHGYWGECEAAPATKEKAEDDSADHGRSNP